MCAVVCQLVVVRSIVLKWGGCRLITLHARLIAIYCEVFGGYATTPYEFHEGDNLSFKIEQLETDNFTSMALSATKTKAKISRKSLCDMEKNMLDNLSML